MPYISSPRPIWVEDLDEAPKGKSQIVLGSNTAGIVIRVGRKGLEFNGYYAGMTESRKHANTREFTFISWEDLEKLRKECFRRKDTKKGKNATPRKPDRVEEPSKEYLESLPIVTLNGRRFYIDAVKSERRPFDAPEQVFNFKRQPSEKPS